MMIKRTGSAPGMGIRAYIALGLTVMTLLFTASFFYFMSMAREVSVSGTRTYGLFMTLAESDKLTDSRNMARLRGAESALAALPSLTAKPAEPEASAALAELSAAIAELATAQPVTDDMLLQLRRTATLAHTASAKKALIHSARGKVCNMRAV